MCLLEEVLDASAETLTCTARVASTGPLGGPGGAPAITCLELAAQAAAVHHGLQNRDRGPGPAPGYLVRARDVKIRPGLLPVDERLEVEIRLEGSAPPLSMYEFRVRDLEGEIARGRISTHSGTELSSPSRLLEGSELDRT